MVEGVRHTAALTDAVAQLRANMPLPKPDVGFDASVVETGVAVRGFRVNTGLFVKLRCPDPHKNAGIVLAPNVTRADLGLAIAGVAGAGAAGTTLVDGTGPVIQDVKLVLAAWAEASRHAHASRYGL